MLHIAPPTDSFEERVPVEWRRYYASRIEHTHRPVSTIRELYHAVIYQQDTCVKAHEERTLLSSACSSPCKLSVQFHRPWPLLQDRGWWRTGRGSGCQSRSGPECRVQWQLLQSCLSGSPSWQGVPPRPAPAFFDQKAWFSTPYL